MITVHHLAYSQSIRILWLMEELGIPYTLKKYERTETLQAPDEFKAVSPLDTSPAITDGDIALAESNAIIDYILDKYANGRLRPEPGSPERTRYLFWFHASQGSMMPMLMFDSIFRIVRTRVPFFIKPVIGPALDQITAAVIRPRLTTIVKKAEEDLAQTPWFAGEALTAADIVMSYCMESAADRGYITEDHPNCRAWIERMSAHPSYQAAMVKDGKPSAVLPL